MARYVVCSAWPYVNNVPHIGNLVGSLLSGDVYQRFLKLMGEDAVYVSGSDEHGSPIEVEARKLGIEPKELTDAMHDYVSRLIREWGIEFDNYTRTHNPTHIRFVQEFMMSIYNNGLIEPRDEVLPYCENDKMFLADRFIEGTCPYCGYERARGDQCENCGRLLHPTELKNPRCVFCGATPVYKKTRHWFFKLPQVRDRLLTWLEKHPNFPDNVRNYSLNWVREGLKERSVTRDNKWGIPAPFPGAEGKTIYVWFEALLGYISATLELFEKRGEPERFKEYWHRGDTRTVFFIGKDNIPFHSIIFPSMIIASGRDHPLPWQISSTEYLLFQEEKFSKSRGIGVWADEALEILPADYWRFALMRMRPEAKDTSFTWKEFYRIVNNELNDDIGNYVHRVLSFIHKRFNAQIPGPGEEDEDDKRLLAAMREQAEKTIRAFQAIRLKQATEHILELARKGNQYLNAQAPWDLVKSNPPRAEAVMLTAAQVVRSLAVLLAPITPKASEAILDTMNLPPPKPGDYPMAGEPLLEPGHPIKKPQPIFRKLPPEFLEKVEEMVEEARRKARAKRPPFKR